jgi:hypothetical protein
MLENNPYVPWPVQKQFEEYFSQQKHIHISSELYTEQVIIVINK